MTYLPSISFRIQRLTGKATYNLQGVDKPTNAVGIIAFGVTVVPGVAAVITIGYDSGAGFMNIAAIDFKTAVAAALQPVVYFPVVMPTEITIANDIRKSLSIKNAQTTDELFVLFVTGDSL